MPTRITVYMIVIITFASLLVVLGCGTGDKGTVSRLGASDVIDAGTDTTDGGGGGATGACIILVSGSGVCYQGQSIDRPLCSSQQGTFHAGQTCAAYGYTNCSTTSGYTVCF